jgi:hypothetical protein
VKTVIKAPLTLIRWVLNRIWYLDPDRTLTMEAAPDACLATLFAAAAPSSDRLQFLELFTHGRRYLFSHASAGGFELRTASRIAWQPGQRSRPTAVLQARFAAMPGSVTLLHTRTRHLLRPLLTAMALPALAALVVVAAPWPDVVRYAIALGLLGLAWTGHRYRGLIEALDMARFLEIALQDLMPTTTPGTDGLLTEGHKMPDADEFLAAWLDYGPQSGSEET